MQCILFVSHITSPRIYRTFRLLNEVKPESFDAIWLYDGTNGAPPWRVRSYPHHIYTIEKLIDAGYPFLGSTLTPGNAHFPIIDFRRLHDEYSHYWVIEYDVRFTGQWVNFFEAWQDSDVDFLSAGLARYTNAKGWVWWDTLHHASEYIPKAQRIRSFNPIYRISKEAVDCIDRAHQNGWTGHFEVVLPTLLHHHGFRIEDFGGDGDFVPDDRTNKFYTSNGLNKIGPDQGTHRYQPRFWRTGNQENKIYHPVKPLSWFVKKKIRYIMQSTRLHNIRILLSKIYKRGK